MWNKIKQVFKKTWKWIVTLFVGSVLVAQIAGLPPEAIMVDLKWHQTYLAYHFPQNASKELESGQSFYIPVDSVAAQGKPYLTRRGDVYSRSATVPDDVVEVFPIGNIGIDEFIGLDGKIIKETRTEAEFHDIKKHKDNRPKKSVVSFRHLFNQKAYAAITINNVVDYECNSCSQTTAEFNMGSATNMVIAVGFGIDSVLEDVDYAGDANNLTQRVISTASVGPAEIWTLDDPDSGTNTLDWDWGGSHSRVRAWAFHGADTHGNNGTTTGGACEDPDVTVSSVTALSILIDTINYVTGADTLDSAKAGQDNENISTQNAGGFTVGSSSETSADGGTVVMGWNTTDAAGCDYAALEIKDDGEAAAAVGRGHRIIFNY